MKPAKTWKEWKDWLTMIVIAGVLVGAFLAPALVIKVQERESDRIIDQIRDESQVRLEQAINVNTYTIACLLAIPPEERTPVIFRACIQEGFDSAPDISNPRNSGD